MNKSPQVRHARTAPRESQRSQKRLEKIAVGSILFTTTMGLVFGQQQCTSGEVRRVLAASTSPAPPAIPPESTSANRPNFKRNIPITTNASKPLDPITAVTVPREEDLYYELKRCEAEWQEQDLFVAYGCNIYSCSPPHCTEGVPGYACWLDSEDRSLNGQRMYFDLDLDNNVVTVAWSPAVLNGPIIRFPSEDFCDEIATQEQQRRRRFEELEYSLKPFSVVPSMVTQSGWRKFSLQINPCESRFRLDISPDLSVGLIYGIDSGKDSTSFEASSLEGVQLALETFLETEYDCSPRITY